MSVVIPLRDVNSVEKISQSGSSSMSKAVLFTLKGDVTFLFAQLQDRDFVVMKIAELLAKIEAAKG